ncbi:MAG: hypothetical protein BACD_00162 [Bacteroides rodentium]
MQGRMTGAVPMAQFPVTLHHGSVSSHRGLSYGRPHILYGETGGNAASADNTASANNTARTDNTAGLAGWQKSGD